MIQYLIVVNKQGNRSPDVPPDIAALGIEPLSARSIVLSALLGTHPPRLAGHHLVALAELFGIRAGTVRTALSRMVSSGELVSENDGYRLGQRLLQRQRQQDDARSSPDGQWDGTWYTAIVAVDRRSVAERRTFRATMTGARMAELRPDVWMRPANIAPPERPEDVLLLRGELEADDADDLVQQLWPLDEIAVRARELHDCLDRHRGSLDAGDPSILPNTFVLSAAAVRFLREEPQLPVGLQPPGWVVPTLRPRYDEFEAAFQVLLRQFLLDLA